MEHSVDGEKLSATHREEAWQMKKTENDKQEVLKVIK